MTEKTMTVMAVDCSSSVPRLAIINGSSVLAEFAGAGGRPHSQVIFDEIEQVLIQAEIQATNLDLIATTTGPGSFTGLRVGIASLFGMGDVLDIPVAGVSTIDAQAFSMQRSGKIVVLQNASRGEIYCGVREVDLTTGLLHRSVPDMTGLPEIIIQRIHSLFHHEPLLITGAGLDQYSHYFQNSASIAQNLRADFIDVSHSGFSAVDVARLALLQFTSGNWQPPVVVYLRPAAEEFRGQADRP